MSSESPKARRRLAAKIAAGDPSPIRKGRVHTILSSVRCAKADASSNVGLPKKVNPARIFPRRFCLDIVCANASYNRADRRNKGDRDAEQQ